MEPTHKIVSMIGAKTKGSGSPMWRCTTDDGQRVNVFLHTDPRRDTYHLFEDAGYHSDMATLQDGQERTWKQHPIPVVLIQDGEWWRVAAVATRPDDAIPDPVFDPDHRLARRQAIRTAQTMIDIHSMLVYWDVETSGPGATGEVISIYIADVKNERPRLLYDSLIKPLNMQIAFTDVHGLTAEQLQRAPALPIIYQDLYDILDRRPWAIYNAPFDTGVLERDCMRHGLDLLVPAAVFDVMDIAAKYCGNWDYERLRYIPPKLKDCAAELGIDTGTPHQAGSDVHTMIAVVEAIARVGLQSDQTVITDQDRKH